MNVWNRMISEREAPHHAWELVVCSARLALHSAFYWDVKFMVTLVRQDSLKRSLLFCPSVLTFLQAGSQPPCLLCLRGTATRAEMEMALDILCLGIFLFVLFFSKA